MSSSTAASSPTQTPTPAPTQTPTQAPTVRGVVAFFVLACALSWAYWIPLAIWSDPVTRGEGTPTHLVGLLGPALAAIVVTAVTAGRRGLRDLGGAAVRLPRKAAGWALAFAPVLAALPVLVAVQFVGSHDPLSHLPRYSGTETGVAALLLALVVTGWGEETGWRGFAQPQLEQLVGARSAPLLVTVGWALWHVPLFFVLASYADFSVWIVPGWFVGLLAGSYVLADVRRRTAGSIAAVAIWHATYDLVAGTDIGDGVVAPILTAVVIAWWIVIMRRMPVE